MHTHVRIKYNSESLLHERATKERALAWPPGGIVGPVLASPGHLGRSRAAGRALVDEREKGPQIW